MTMYTIRFHGHLDAHWATLFDGFTITHEYTPNREPITVMTGPIIDQSALYGLLSQMRNLGAALVSVQPEGMDDRQT